VQFGSRVAFNPFGLIRKTSMLFLAPLPDADVHGSSSLMAQEDGDGHWRVSIGLSGEWIHRHHGGPPSGSKIVIALTYNSHLDMPGLEVLKSQFIYVHKASTTMN
jgi:hypothetical protein